MNPDTTLADLDDRLRLEALRVRLRLHRTILRLRRAWATDPLHGQPVISDEHVDRLLQATPEPDDKTRTGATEDRHEDDPADQAITQRLLDLDRRIHAHRKTHPHPLDTLAARLALPDLDLDILHICAARHTDPDLHPLFAYAQDDPAATRPTPALLNLLLDRHDTWTALHPDAPLRRSGLLDAQNLGPDTDLDVHERVLWNLRGLDAPEPALRPLLDPIPAAPLTHTQETTLQALADRILQDDPPAPGILHLHGAPGTGRHAFACALAHRLGLGLVRIRHKALPTDPTERADTLHRLRREAILSGRAFLLDAPAPDDLLLDPPGFTLLVGDGTERIDAPTLRIAVPTPDHADRIHVWTQALGIDGNAPATPDDLGDLAQGIRLGATDVLHAVHAARQSARLRTTPAADTPTPNPTPTMDDLWAAARHRLLRDLGGLAHRIEPQATWDDLILPDALRTQLHDLAAQIRHHGRVHDDWGAASRIRTGLGVTALFAGPSGTGKTLAAEVLAHHLHLDLQRVNLAALVSKYIGETEKNLDRVFDAAERSGAILFFDEADAIFGKRTEVSSSHDRYANLEVDHLLQRMERYEGLAILATNRKADLDRAFLRRLRFVLEFPQPDETARRRIWTRLIPPRIPRADDVDLDALARLDLSGGSIRNIVLNAAFLAADDDGTLRARHLHEAARREFAKMDRRMAEVARMEVHP